MNMPTCKEAGNRPLYTSTQLTVSNEGKKLFAISRTCPLSGRRHMVYMTTQTLYKIQ